MTHYHCVEPHSDDCFLSLHAHMVAWLKAGHQVTIHTMIAVHRDSLKEAKAYADSIGADWEGYDLTRKERGDVSGWERVAIPKDGQLILPIAIKHPDHVAVRDWLDRKGAWWFVDQPYAITQSSSEHLTELLQGMEVVSYIKPRSRKYKSHTIFKCQGRFFHFNPPEKLRETFEMIVRRPKK